LAEIKNIDLQLQTSLDENLIVKLDKSKFEKIINNLLANALKYTSAGGNVTLTVMQQNDTFLFKVEDTGRGIHQKDLPNIFNRFYQARHQTEPLRGGTGVGLALCKEFVYMMGGNISVGSEIEKGSTFLVELPLEIGQVEHHNTSIGTEEETLTRYIPTYQPISINGEKPKLLIVEDHQEMSHYLVEILSKDYHCITAHDGKKALQLLRKHQFDGITSDVMMPNMDGFELREAINQNDEWKHIPFLLLTARHLERDKIRGFQLGIDDYITKPFSTKELQARLHNLISNKIERDYFYQTEAKVNEIQTPIHKNFIKSCEKVVLENLEDLDFKVADLAKAMNYSPKQLGRLIKKETGLTTILFILEIRLQKARELLEKGLVNSVFEAQIQVGMSSHSYFTRKFTERFGKNPKDVRPV
jgi:DNA-binding response OmpR family regulator/anti-sigma regulatory factor (Ser/Thr protein kinase)